jgi:hypothetical protein
MFQRTQKCIQDQQPYSFGNIHDMMQALQHQNEEAHLNTAKRFYTYTEYTNNNHFNDNQTIFPNKIFDIFLKPYQP